MIFVIKASKDLTVIIIFIFRAVYYNRMSSSGGLFGFLDAYYSALNGYCTYPFAASGADDRINDKSRSDGHYQTARRTVNEEFRYFFKCRRIKDP